MATSKPIAAGFDFKRLPGGTRWGSQAFYRKVATQDARLAMAGILKQYEALINRFKQASPEILENALRPVFKLSQKYVPEDTGALWESGKLTSGRDSNRRAYANITYGSDEAWYAAIVHEFTWLNHQAPERSKYLQAALEESYDDVMTSLAVNYSGLL